MRIDNVKVINFDQTIDNATVEIENGKIKNVIPKIGESNKILIPGFIDIHMHGMMGHDFMDGKEATEKISNEVVKFGVTSIVPTIMTRELDVMLKSLFDISRAKSIGANIIAIHSEGPFISLNRKGAHNPDLIMDGDSKVLKKMYKASHGLLRKMTIAPENCKNDFIKKMVKLDIVPSIGHTDASAERVNEVIALGALHCTHLWNAMSGVENRNPGAAEEILLNKDIYAEVIADFIHVDEKTLELTYRSKGSDRIILVTDSIRPAGLEDGESESGGIKIVKKGLKITLKGTDTIAGSAATMYDCFRNVLKMGVSIQEAVKMSSYNAAKSLNLKKGLISEGYDADLIILDEELKVENVFINGDKIPI